MAITSAFEEKPCGNRVWFNSWLFRIVFWEIRWLGFLFFNDWADHRSALVNANLLTTVISLLLSKPHKLKCLRLGKSLSWSHIYPRSIFYEHLIKGRKKSWNISFRNSLSKERLTCRQHLQLWWKKCRGGISANF